MGIWERVGPVGPILIFGGVRLTPIPQASWGDSFQCSSLGGVIFELGAAIMIHGNDHLSSGVSFSKIPDGVRCLAEGITSIDHGHDSSGLKKLPHEDQILLLHSRYPPY